MYLRDTPVCFFRAHAKMSSTTARGTASTRRAAAPAAGRQARRTAPAAEPAAIAEERVWEMRVGVGEVDGGSARPLGSRRGGVRKEGPEATRSC